MYEGRSFMNVIKLACSNLTESFINFSSSSFYIGKQNFTYLAFKALFTFGGNLICKVNHDLQLQFVYTNHIPVVHDEYKCNDLQT